MVDPAGRSFVILYARVTHTAVQTGAKSARVMPGGCPGTRGTWGGGPLPEPCRAV